MLYPFCEEITDVFSKCPGDLGATTICGVRGDRRFQLRDQGRKRVLELHSAASRGTPIRERLRSMSSRPLPMNCTPASDSRGRRPSRRVPRRAPFGLRPSQYSRDSKSSLHGTLALSSGNQYQREVFHDAGAEEGYIVECCVKCDIVCAAGWYTRRVRGRQRRMQQNKQDWGERSVGVAARGCVAKGKNIRR